MENQKENVDQVGEVRKGEVEQEWQRGTFLHRARRNERLEEEERQCKVLKVVQMG
jgi:hypothetical protein